MELSETEAHIWFICSDYPLTSLSEEQQSLYTESLDEAELKRSEDYLFETDRNFFIFSRFTLRRILASYLGLKPSEVKLGTTSYGRPTILNSEQDHRLQFNLSHSEGRVAVGICLDREIGIDVEVTPGEKRILEMASLGLSPSEQEAFLSLDPARQKERFFEYWTLKEAFTKALGVGYKLPFNKVQFEFKEEGGIKLSRSGNRNENPADWQFQLSKPDSVSQMAVALRKGPYPDLNLLLLSF